MNKDKFGINMWETHDITSGARGWNTDAYWPPAIHGQESGVTFSAVFVTSGYFYNTKQFAGIFALDSNVHECCSFRPVLWSE